ncbi:hypothetical protein OXX69_007722 [Metschnikowia pulcherrima]
MSTHSPEDVVSDYRASGDQGPEAKSARSRRSKACKQCHALKVRCIPVDENDPASSCVRCLNSNKVCEIDTLEPKKRRKKTHSKPEKDSVADLKSQIAALQSEVNFLRSRPASEQNESLNSGNSHQNNQSPLNSMSDAFSPPFMTKTDLEKEVGILGGNDLSLKDISDEIKEYTLLRENTLRNDQPVDVVSLRIIDLDSAKVRLDMYRTILYASHSYVNIPDSQTVEELMTSQPFLLNAVMAITCTVLKDDTELQRCLALEKHAIASITQEILVNGSKSVELVKCLILLSAWYNTPEFFKARRYHILNQMAVTLLYDLGIVNRQAFTYSGETKTIKKSESSFNDIEYRMLVMTLYCSSVGFCLILRRAIFVKWTPYVEECCSLLEKHQDRRYRNIALFSRLTRELEKVHHIVHSPECFVTNPRVSTYTMTELNTRLAVIGNSLDPENHVLLAYYYSIEAYLYQPSSEDLRVRSVGLNCTEELTTRTLNTVSQCTTSCLKAMDEFNQLTEEQIAGLPLFHFTRIIYTAGILMRLRYFILSLPSNIEKDLVPRHAIVAVSNLHQRINSISDSYPTNFLMKKMKLVFRLFVQTYVTQVNELLSRNDDGSQSLISTQIPKSDYKNMNKLAFSILNASQGSSMGHNYSPGVHLDLLSYAATEHSKSNGLQAEAKKNGNEHSGSHTAKNGSIQEPPNNSQSQPQVSTSNIPPQLHPMPDHRVNSSGHFANGEMYPMAPVQVNNQMAPPQVNNPMFRPLNQGETSMVLGGSQNNLGDQNKDVYEFDDEFWSNLLSADANKYFFAQDAPNGSENVLYNIFS